MRRFVFALLFVASSASAKMAPVVDVDYGLLKAPVEFDWGADPFEKTPGFQQIDPALAATAGIQMKLEAVIYDPKEPMAVVGGQPVGVGDEIGDKKVAVIGPNYVILEGQGSKLELTLPPAKPKAPESKEKAP